MKAIGLDCATWKMIKPNLDSLPNFKKLMDNGNSDELRLDITPLSAVVWASIFTGKSPEEHGHTNFVIGGKLQRREDVKADFIWDVLDGLGFDARALNIPFVYPPYNFRTEFNPANYGLSLTVEELEKDAHQLFLRSLEVLGTGPDFFAVVFDQLDKIQHYHWGEPVVLDMYKRLDAYLGKLVKPDDELIVISDHGCTDEERFVFANKHKKNGPPLKGFHDDRCILITQNVEFQIKNIYDVFMAVEESFSP